MKTSINSELTKAFLVFGFFLLMALLNFIAAWDHAHAATRYRNEWQRDLFLNARQEEHISTLDKEFYQELSKAYSDTYLNEDEFCFKVRQIMESRNQKIEKALTMEQRKKFQTFLSCQILP